MCFVQYFIYSSKLGFCMMFSEFGFFIYLIFFRARVGGGSGGGKDDT